jgi:hypothetical protein
MSQKRAQETLAHIARLRAGNDHTPAGAPEGSERTGHGGSIGDARTYK